LDYALQIAKIDRKIRENRIEQEKAMIASEYGRLNALYVRCNDLHDELATLNAQTLRDLSVSTVG
jgi:hypothetical protein